MVNDTIYIITLETSGHEGDMLIGIFKTHDEAEGYLATVEKMSHEQYIINKIGYGPISESITVSL